VFKQQQVRYTDKDADMNAGMTALTELNALRAEARNLGIPKPNTMKRPELEAAIAAANLDNWAAQERKQAEKDAGDPFDEIDPTVEGDHLTVADVKAERDITREAWLMSAVELLIPVLEQAGATNVRGRKYQVSVSFPSKTTRKRIGECWHLSSSEDGATANLLISPTLDDPIKVLGVLAHEMIHMDDDGVSNHGGHFRRVALAMGLEGKMTSTSVGDQLKPILEDVAKELGTYPHVRLNLGLQKTQTTRMIKVECQNEECDFTDDNGKRLVIRLTRKWIDVDCIPSCACGEKMAVAE
jgi:hypothetical protein